MALPIVAGVAVVILLGGFARIAIFGRGSSRLDAQVGNPWFYAELFFIFLACAFVVGSATRRSFIAHNAVSPAIR
jgi:hypothetical protein